MTNYVCMWYKYLADNSCTLNTHWHQILKWQLQRRRRQRHIVKCFIYVKREWKTKSNDRKRIEFLAIFICYSFFRSLNEWLKIKAEYNDGQTDIQTDRQINRYTWQAERMKTRKKMLKSCKIHKRKSKKKNGEKRIQVMTILCISNVCCCRCFSCLRH